MKVHQHTPDRHEDRESYSKSIVKEMGHFDTLTTKYLKTACVTSWTHQEVFRIVADTVTGENVERG